MNASEIRAKMEELNGFIMDAEMKLAGGSITDLSGLDKTVAMICTKAVTLPPEQARSIQPAMAELIGNLERLSLALKDYKDNLKS